MIRYVIHQTFLLLILFLLTFTIFDRSVQNSIPQLFFNSDSLIYYDFIKSIHDLQSISKWSLPPSNCLFPDLILHLIFQSIFKKPIYTLIFFAISQIFSILFAFFYLNSILFKEKETIQNANITVSTSLIFILLYIIIGKDVSNLQNLLTPGHHAGIFPIILINLAIILKNKQDVKYLILLFLLIVLTVASDKIFLLQFSVPALAFLFFIDKRKRDKFQLAVVILIGSMVGLKLESVIRNYLKFLNHNFFTLTYTKIFDLANLNLLNFEQWQRTLLVFKTELSNFSIFVISVGIFLIPIFILLNKNKSQLSKVLIFIFLLTISNTIVLFILKYFLDMFASRYLLPAFSFPFIFICIFISNRYPESIKLFSISCGIIAAFLILNNLNGQFYRLTNFQPEPAKCLDQFYSKFSLTRGASDYWTARPSTVFATKDILVYPIETDFGVSLWNTNLKYYKVSNLKSPQFFILQRDKTSLDLTKFGEPNSKFQCGIYEFWIYEESNPSLIRYTEDMKKKLLLWEKLTGREF